MSNCPVLEYFPLTGSLDALPDELLAEIFVWWADIDEDGAWMASCISHRWRRVVLACSAAWCRVWVNFRPAIKKKDEEDEEWCVEEEVDDVDDYRGKARPISLWLQRSGTKQIYLSIQVGAVPPPGIALMDLVNMLEPYFPRVWEVALVIEYPLVADVLLGMLWQHAPALVDISITCPMKLITGEKRIMESLWGALDKARGVKSLTCTGCLLPKSNPVYQHSVLRTIVLQDVRESISVIVDGLAACQSLEELSILGACIDGPNGPPTKPVILPALTSLYFEGTSHGILNHLQTPSLHTLEFRNLVPYSALECGIDTDRITAAQEDFGGELAAFIERGTQLERMHLERSSIPDASFIRILKQIRDLRHLHLTDSFTSNSLILGLIQKKLGKRSLLCPELQNIILDSCPRVSGNTLIEFIQSRQSTPFPVTSLSIARCSLVNAQHVQILKSIDPERLRVHVIPDIEC
jgi:hypothetical protein